MAPQQYSICYLNVKCKFLLTIQNHYFLMGQKVGSVNAGSIDLESTEGLLCNA